MLGRLVLAKQQGKTFMNSVIQKQEGIVTQLQLAIEHYLEEGNLELAFTYSELFKINCEAYKALVGSTEVKEEKPVFKFGKQAAQSNTILQTHLNKAEELQLNYEKQMRREYAQQQGQQQVQQREAVRVSQPVVSQYSYGDGQDNPKIRANDSYGNWGGNGEPNEIVTPPQQLINNSRIATGRAYSDGVAINEEDNLWGDDPRRSLNRG